MQIKLLEAQGMRCVALSLPGYEQRLDSVHRWGWSTAEMVDYIKDAVVQVSRPGAWGR